MKLKSTVLCLALGLLSIAPAAWATQGPPVYPLTLTPSLPHIVVAADLKPSSYASRPQDRVYLLSEDAPIVGISAREIPAGTMWSKARNSTLWIAPSFGPRNAVMELPGGWLLSQNGDCLSGRLSIWSALGQKGASIDLKRERNSNFMSRRMKCSIGGGAHQVYELVVLNSRYFAFSTAEPSWVFFDRQTGQFLPFMLGNQEDNVRLFASETGEVFADARYGASSKDPHNYPFDALFKLKFQGRELTASHDPQDALDLVRIRADQQCAGDTANGRPCSPVK